MADLLFVARHGQTRWNQEGRMQGQRDSPLTPTGQAQARILGQALAGEQISHIVASSLGRAVETAQWMAQTLGCPVDADDRLIERSFGAFEGRKVVDLAQVAAAQPVLALQDPDSRAPGGESLQDVADRALLALTQARQLPGPAVAIVTHGHVLMAILGSLLGDRDYRQYHHANGAYTQLGWTGQRWEVQRWAVGAHLVGMP